MKTKQVSEWAGKFGDEYIDRNPCTEELLIKRTAAFAQMLRPLGREMPCSILEVGANIGHNIKALQRISLSKLYALDPNKRALETLVRESVLPIDQVQHGAVESLPYSNETMDLVMTCTVLIHVPEETIGRACNEIYRVARKNILIIEYFSPKTELVRYQGQDDMLFKRDYGEMFLKYFPDLKLVDYGFFWKPITALDNVNYWLFRK